MEKIAPANRSSYGPFDVSEFTLPTNHVNLGSIVVIPDEETALRLEVDESTGNVVAITLEKANSILQVVAFAAPNSEGLWSEVMNQLYSSITSNGGSVTEGNSALGPNLTAIIPQSEGAARHIKFIGVDGPRWFLRGSITGAALQDPLASEQIDALFRSLVVNRGNAPMPPREALPLRLPEGAIAPPRTEF